MQPYERRLKNPSRRLRGAMSRAEQRLWHLLRRGQVCGVRFYRQKPLLGYIVDFYAPAAGLVVEVDGSQHLGAEGLAADAVRTAALNALGLEVLRFDNLQALNETAAVMEVIFGVVSRRVRR
ncbi:MULTISPECIES: endonuclease domain-containing protein [unclassified Lysobacter]|uniref:endonuclease domain-containing protein n=1 Tax=unclassified Lysobacter TaxID=2635362 RepID=UPI001BEA3556|nr:MULTISPECIES: endonuclease domain-containing protein [unclassified Lysobacter]MBT2749034.1 DUF559 domain-containing protein [Lysobacter sp. ISL-42]MBT2750367.1 DUF559 domain-containing protein [Lysobacter sp. ISL-50]MBT2778465.1 DUF559 domain-containing protein [Lysobacter sp. ISL-54]MBT2781081.1 DUF559 domain-containing protein [Lysobacter sp. ISL-52]